VACQRVGVASSYVASALVDAALARLGLALALDTSTLAAPSSLAQ